MLQRNYFTKLNQETLEQVISILPNYEMFLFDFDGVIADTEVYHAQAYCLVLKEYGIDFSLKLFEDYIGKPEFQIYDQLEQTYGISINREDFMEKRLLKFLSLMSQYKVKPNMFILEILNNISNLGRGSFIVSSQKDFVINKLLKDWGLDSNFLNVYTVYNTQKKKEVIIEEMHAKYNRSLLFEDSERIIKLANKLGIETIGFMHDANANTQLSAKYIFNCKNNLD